MSVGLNAAQARAKASQDMIVFNETQAIMKSVITQSALGNFEAYVDDATTMTTSTPTSLKIGTTNTPTISIGDTVIIGSSTITLGTSGTSLNAVISDINDAGIAGITASKDAGYLVLTIEGSAASWNYVIGAGTANTALGITAGTYSIANPASVGYFNVWQGTAIDRGLQNQMESVIKHFQNLGYKLERITNASTSNTLKWYIYW
jgi:hypothetical protein|tara:strand:- start:120 stop:734 length:615 start_codon:yes stop_codon:yes gene_type:complete